PQRRSETGVALPESELTQHPTPNTQHPNPVTIADQKISNIERRWQLPLPEEFRRLYRVFEQPFISPCEFLPLDALADDSERWSGMLPHFVPFGHDGSEDYYGFY